MSAAEQLQPERQPVIVSYGAGTNSTAMLIELVRRGTPPNLILFADTGGERPETYGFITTFDRWLREHGAPGVTLVHYVRRDGSRHTLELDCLKKGMLPSLAYGFKSCSLRFKRDPQDKFVNHWEPAVAWWRGGGKVVKYIGYHSGESRRYDRAVKEDEKYVYRFPLVEWGWDGAKCRDVIAEVGLTSPGKSACFFCPATTKPEIIELSRRHPQLYKRALDMEAGARENLQTVRGLGRKFSWADVYELKDDDAPSIPCECYDGSGVAEVDDDE